MLVCLAYAALLTTAQNAHEFHPPTSASLATWHWANVASRHGYPGRTRPLERTDGGTNGELRAQFERIAQLQQEVDQLKLAVKKQS